MLTSVDARHQADQASHVALSVAAQSLFGGPQAPETVPVVILKRRRIAVPDEKAELTPEARVEARQPKVHLVTREATEVSKEAGTTQLSEPSRARAEVEAALPTIAPKRPRRRLNGKVRVLAVGPTIGEVNHLATDNAPEMLADSPTAFPATAVSFVGPGGKYQQVIAQIEKLQARADNLKRQEAAAAVRWVREAIALYGLTARDVGL